MFNIDWHFYFTEYGFTQIVDFPTRQGHVLDIVLIDEMQRVYCL